MYTLYNTLIFIALASVGGGRYDWAYIGGAFLLSLNAVPFICRLIQQRGYLLGKGLSFWGLCVLFPWTLFGCLFVAALSNPSHQLLYPNNLFSPLIPIEYYSWLPTTPNPDRSQLFLFFIIGSLCVPLNILTAPVRRSHLRICLGITFIFGALLAGIGSVIKLVGNTHLLGVIELREPVTFGTFFYMNHWAYFAILAAGCGMGLFHSTYARERQQGHFPEKSVGLVLLVLLLMSSILIAEARGATVVLMPLASLFLFSVLRPLRQRYPRNAILLTIIALCAGSWALYTVASPQVDKSIIYSERQLEAVQSEDYTIVKRLAMYRDGWNMFQDRPLWGWGIGSFIHIHPIYAGEEFYKQGANYPVAYEFAHSDYVQSLAEFGVAGCILLFTPFACLLFCVRNYIRYRINLSFWLLGACLAITTVALIDMVFTAPAITTGVLLLASVAIRYEIEGYLKRRSR
jgi:O-antigen ligase